MGSKASVAHGVTTKFVPFFFAFLALLYISDFTRGNIIPLIDPTDMFLSVSLFIAGLVLIYEGANHWPQKNTTFGAGGAAFLFIFASANIIAGILIITDLYQPLQDSGDWNLILQVVLGVSVITILIQGLYEVKTAHRLLANKVLG